MSEATQCCVFACDYSQKTINVYNSENQKCSFEKQTSWKLPKDALCI